MDQVAQQPVQGPLAIELVEDQAHHLLNLLVGVEGQASSRLADIADRRVVEQLAAAGLVQPPLVHPGAEEVQFGLAHDALERCNITHSHSTFAGFGSVSSRIVAQRSATSLPP